jgi:hydroxymethylbilane synthase
MSTVRLATRASDLALAQARLMAGMLQAQLGVATELVVLTTTGDRIQDVSLAKLGGKGLFVKEIEEALLDGRADLAVHSAKDLPAFLPQGLELVAFPERVDPRDALVARERGASLEGLPRGARVGTGSVRRTAQLRAFRSDLDVVPLRGNVPTRLRKLEDENLDAVILACAGLERLGLADRIDERLSPDLMLPAVTQGILAIEGRVGDPIARDAAALGHEPSAAQAAAERAVLERLEADCNVPLAAFAEPSEGGLRLRTLLAASGGERVARAEDEGPARAAAALGTRVAEALLADGGDQILAGLRSGGAE